MEPSDKADEGAGPINGVAQYTTWLLGTVPFVIAGSMYLLQRGLKALGCELDPFSGSSQSDLESGLEFSFATLTLVLPLLLGVLSALAAYAARQRYFCWRSFVAQGGEKDDWRGRTPASAKDSLRHWLRLALWLPAAGVLFHGTTTAFIVIDRGAACEGPFPRAAFRVAPFGVVDAGYLFLLGTVCALSLYEAVRWARSYDEVMLNERLPRSATRSGVSRTAR